ncbi:unnamed protein product, partial [marine sediment metagenome]
MLVLAVLTVGVVAAETADRKPGGGPAPRGLFHPKDAAVSGEMRHKFVWRDACGNSMDDHQLAG